MNLKTAKMKSNWFLGKFEFEIVFNSINFRPPAHRKHENVIGRWSTRDVHDPKFNEEKLAVQFRAGRLGCFGLAVNWYANLPFQVKNWNKFI